MAKIPTYDKLRDYFYGVCGADDQAWIREWLIEDPDSEETDAILRPLLDEARVHDPEMAQEAFEEFCRRIGYTAPAQRSARRSERFVRWTRRIAAILTIPLIVALSVMYFHSRSSGAPEWEERMIPMGERGELLLSDGTLLRLNSGTRVTYPVEFNGKQRKIFVDGEIYAEVARDESKPFVVSSGEVRVEVLGTTFNMRAYGTDSSVELALIEGSVRFEVDSDKCNEQVVMLRNDMASYDRLTGKLEMTTFQSVDYRPRAAGGGFYFFNESLEDIAAQLSRSFNRRIVIADGKLAQANFYALFTNDESLPDILETLNADRSMDIQDRDGVVYITSRNKR